MEVLEDDIAVVDGKVVLDFEMNTTDDNRVDVKVVDAAPVEL